MLPRHLLPTGTGTSTKVNHFTVNKVAEARPNPATCEVARHIDEWRHTPTSAREKYKALVVGALDLRSFDDFANVKCTEAFEQRMDEALRNGPPDNESSAMKPGVKDET